MPCLVFHPCNAEEATAGEISLPDVFVYSTKHTELLRDVPVAIDVLDRQTINSKQVHDLYDINHAVANVSIQQSGFYKSISLRGIGGGGRNAGFSTRVGVYLDGVYVGQTLALDNPLIDVEQIEIFKGPQGYLFGNSADAGVINILSRQPSHHAETSLQSGLGNLGYWTHKLTSNGEITPDLTGRFTLLRESRDGYVENTFNGNDLKGLSNIAWRTQFKFEASDALNLTFSADYMHKRHSQFLAQAQTGLFGHQ